MVLALLGALCIGISLGLIGAGGSILTVPVLIFIVQRPEKLAIAESLAIVGGVAFMGAIPYALRSQIHWKSVFLLGIPGMLGAYLGACGSYYISGSIQLILFAVIMLGVAGIMLGTSPSLEKEIPFQQAMSVTTIEGFLIGCLTGCIGVGGGFLIIPTLVLFNHLSMYLAIGTSLMIISLNALTGFIKQLSALNALHMQVSWEIISLISVMGILGSLGGSYLSNTISQLRLRQGFGLSVLLIGTYILLKKM